MNTYLESITSIDNRLIHQHTHAHTHTHTHTHLPGEVNHISYTQRHWPWHNYTYRGFPFSTHASRGRGGGASSLLYIAIAYDIQKGWEGVQIACKIVYVLNGRPHTMITFWLSQLPTTKQLPRVVKSFDQIPDLHICSL